MVGAFMQGMLLMGVIYWYSKGMLNMINEYYRTEFAKQLDTKTVDRKPVIEQDEIEILLKKEKEKYHSLVSSDISESEFCPVRHQADVCLSETELKRFLELTLSVCFSNKSDLLDSSRVCQEIIANDVVKIG